MKYQEKTRRRYQIMNGFILQVFLLAVMVACVRCDPSCNFTIEAGTVCCICPDDSTCFATCLDNKYISENSSYYDDLCSSNTPGFTDQSTASYPSMSTELQCEVCDISCKKCIEPGNDQCLICEDKYIKDHFPADNTDLVINYTCISNCSEGHFYNGISCLPCSKNCTTCKDDQTCTECSQGTYLQGSVCVLQCSQDLAANNVTWTCDELQSSEDTKWIIIGPAIGGGVLLIIVVVLVILYFHRRKAKHSSVLENRTSTLPSKEDFELNTKKEKSKRYIKKPVGPSSIKDDEPYQVVTAHFTGSAKPEEKHEEEPTSVTVEEQHPLTRPVVGESVYQNVPLRETQDNTDTHADDQKHYQSPGSNEELNPSPVYENMQIGAKATNKNKGKPTKGKKRKKKITAEKPIVKTEENVNGPAQNLGVSESNEPLDETTTVDQTASGEGAIYGNVEQEPPLYGNVDPSEEGPTYGNVEMTADGPIMPPTT